ncbi:hypothetical protein C8F04DRAFT_1189495 [Mycena alexandri]|uniref:Uncharacterized protein n=1 Tax=Mycena alexandri TaxID=1745969 RepID=A0AAD6SGF9_9AGAR|nr:hypothetical protein C8F04DRAFT_1189495 [Mycena alexandri]
MAWKNLNQRRLISVPTASWWQSGNLGRLRALPTAGIGMRLHPTHSVPFPLDAGILCREAVLENGTDPRRAENVPYIRYVTRCVNTEGEPYTYGHDTKASRAGGERATIRWITYRIRTIKRNSIKLNKVQVTLPEYGAGAKTAHGTIGNRQCAKSRGYMGKSSVKTPPKCNELTVHIGLKQGFIYFFQAEVKARSPAIGAHQ